MTVISRMHMSTWENTICSDKLSGNLFILVLLPSDATLENEKWRLLLKPRRSQLTLLYSKIRILLKIKLQPFVRAIGLDRMFLINIFVEMYDVITNFVLFSFVFKWLLKSIRMAHKGSTKTFLNSSIQEDNKTKVLLEKFILTFVHILIFQRPV